MLLKILLSSHYIETNGMINMVTEPFSESHLPFDFIPRFLYDSLGIKEKPVHIKY